MLILSRKRNEGLLISSKDGDILVDVIEIRPGQVRIGVTAPKHVRIVRGELLRRQPRKGG